LEELLPKGINLLVDEVLAWCSAMLAAGRMGFIASEPLEAPRGRGQLAKE
jgi:hypothetical protein